MRWVSSSRELWHKFKDSAALWGSLAVEHERLQQAELFGVWVSGRRELVRHLELALRPRWHGQLQSPYVSEDIALSTVSLLGSLAGGPLESLTWSLRSSTRLGSWAFRLPSLQCLSITWEQRTGHLALSCEFGARLVPRLTSLSVAGAVDLAWAPGCLPAGLRELTVANIRKEDLVSLVASAASSCASSLQCLTISSEDVYQMDVYRPWDLGPLRWFTALTSLQLLDSARRWPALQPLEQLPLHRLALCFTGHGSEGQHALLPVARALTALTSLAIDDCTIRGLGEEVWRMPSLQVGWHGG